MKGVRVTASDIKSSEDVETQNLWLESDQSLTALSPLDGRYAGRLKSIRSEFCEAQLIVLRLRIEVQWWIMLSDLKLPQLKSFSEAARTRLMDWLDGELVHFHAARVKEIEQRTNHDVKAVEYYLKSWALSDPELASAAEFIHFGCTSEDINNLAYSLMLDGVRRRALIPGIRSVLEVFRANAHRYAAVPMISRTHGQIASPTTIGKEFANVLVRLNEALIQWEMVLPRGKWNGAVGNYNAHQVAFPNVAWESVAARFVQSFGLTFCAYSTQIEPHDWMAQYFDAVSRLNTILFDASRDLWGYISLGYFKQKVMPGEVGSSTMPHKVNPIDFENAEGNLGLANALLGHLSRKLPVSRWQRDLTDSTVLRSVGVALGYSFLAWDSFLRGLNKLDLDAEKIQLDIENAWEILAEPIQTVMRKYGISNSYEQLKDLTRGKKLTAETLIDFIRQLPLPEEEKERLCFLTPQNYIGLAEILARRI